MFDRNMRYLRSSLEWRRACGLSDAPLAGMCHYDIFPEMHEDWKEAHRRGMAGEIVKGEEPSDSTRTVSRLISVGSPPLGRLWS